MNATEEWIEIPGYNGIYFVNKSGEVYGTYRSRVLKPKPTPTGYMQINLYNSVTKIKKTVYIHRLTAIAFIPNPENKEEVNHIDGNKRNNSASNLEWTTAQENVIHAVKNKLIKHSCGNGCHASKLDESKVRQIFLSDKRRVDIIKEFGVSLDTVYGIRCGRYWKHLNLGNRYAIAS